MVSFMLQFTASISSMKYINFSIVRLPFSKPFKEACANNNLTRLGDLMETTIEKLAALPGFNWAMLEELKDFLSDHGVIITPPGHDGTGL
jgi:hypothetical protein